MAYTDIASTEFDPGEPVKSEHGKTFFDNPKAIASHDDSGDTAPRIWADDTASDASAISSTGTESYILAVSDTASPDGHGKLVAPLDPVTIGLSSGWGYENIPSGRDNFYIENVPSTYGWSLQLWIEANFSTKLYGCTAIYDPTTEDVKIIHFNQASSTFDTLDPTFEGITISYSTANEEINVNITLASSEELNKIKWIWTPATFEMSSRSAT